jgi:hypothetical protein
MAIDAKLGTGIAGTSITCGEVSGIRLVATARSHRVDLGLNRFVEILKSFVRSVRSKTFDAFL